MSAFAQRGRLVRVAVKTALLGVRNDLTPGQRWTALLALGLVATMIAFGTPTRFRLVDDESGPGPGGAQLAMPAPPEEPSVPGQDLPSASADSAAPAAPYVPVDDGTGESLATGPGRDIVALVGTNLSLPGRDEAAIAQAFMEWAELSGEIVPLAEPAPVVCEKLAHARIVLSGVGPGAAIRDCIVQGGGTLLAFDELGHSAPPGSGQVVSTRRAIEASLTDLALWGARSGALRGRTGIVATTRTEPHVRPVVPAMRVLGVDVVDVAYVSEDTGSLQMTEAVRRFASKNVQVVVFAAPVALQQQWVLQENVIHPGMRYVVSDVADGVLNESYPPTFEGALAHTSLRLPWFSREHGETTIQASCREEWQRRAPPVATVPPDELLKVFAWCLHTQLMRTALNVGGIPLGQAIRSLPTTSPLTSDLGPLPDGGFGPRQDAVLVWRSSCACWQQSRPYADRSS